MIELKIRPIREWPGPSTTRRQMGRFRTAWNRTNKFLMRELRHIGATRAILELEVLDGDIRNDGWIRANARTRGPGVILSIETKMHGALRYPCDTFTGWQDNVRAIALSLEALRAVDRYGVTRRGEQYRGFGALPAPMASESMTPEVAASVLVQGTPFSVSDVLHDLNCCESLYRQQAKQYHSDHGGDLDHFNRVTAAIRILRASQN